MFRIRIKNISTVRSKRSLETVTAILSIITAKQSRASDTHTTPPPAAPQTGLGPSELGMERVVLVVDAPVGRRRKQEMVSSLLSFTQQDDDELDSLGLTTAWDTLSSPG